MEEVKKALLAKLVKSLAALGEDVRWAIEADGETFGGATLMPEKKGRGKQARPSTRPYGTLRNYAAPFFKGCKEGDVIKVPFDKFGYRDTTNAITPMTNYYLGKGCVTTCINHEGGYVEALILDMSRSEAKAGQQAFEDWHNGRHGRLKGWTGADDLFPEG